ncbi:MAG: SseB family protein [Pseudomonadota bacterium]
MTMLDQAHADMQSGGDAERLRFYERFADAELFLLLAHEADGTRIVPRVFPLEDGPVVLVFDTEERLAAFADGADYAAMSGRSLAGLLAGRKLGLGLNLGIAPSSFLMEPGGVDWLADMLQGTPDEAETKIVEVGTPVGLPEALLSAIDAKLAGLSGLARYAWLAAVRYQGNRLGHMLVFTDPVPGAEPALAQAVREALVFSAIDAGELDVTFLKASDPMAARLAKVALRFDLPEPEAPSGPAVPGSNPDRPPKLR